MPERQILTQISPRAWEHPADRAALNTLRALPGFDEVVKKVFAVLGEKGVRQLFLANAVRVGPRQRPKLDELYSEVLATLDCDTRWDLYVSQTPVANAMAVGMDRPFIVVNSGMLTILDREERRNVLAHEVGHIMSGHATYTTIALLLILLGARNMPWLAGIAFLPIQLALLEWYRKAEFTADRAGLLGSQDLKSSMSVYLKLAGGGAGDDEIDLDAFLAQAAEYETEGDAVDRVWKVLNTAFQTHPFATVRAAELQRWVSAGDYDRILRGEYPRRGTDDRPLTEDYAEAGSYYRQKAQDAYNTASDVLTRARDAFTDRMRRGS